MSMLSDEYCEGWCADGCKGSWEDCTGCAIHKIESQLSAEREANKGLREAAEAYQTQSGHTAKLEAKVERLETAITTAIGRIDNLNDFGDIREVLEWALEEDHD